MNDSRCENPIIYYVFERSFCENHIIYYVLETPKILIFLAMYANLCFHYVLKGSQLEPMPQMTIKFQNLPRLTDPPKT
jgi:hypothetical protein